LVADDDDLVAAAGDRGTDVVGRRSWCEPLVGLGRDVERPRELAAGLTGPEQGARQDRHGPRVLVPQALPEPPRLLATLRGQPPELVQLSRLGLCVADEVEAHGD
jgi:hypothetical protein